MIVPLLISNVETHLNNVAHKSIFSSRSCLKIPFFHFIPFFPLRHIDLSRSCFFWPPEPAPPFPFFRAAGFLLRPGVFLYHRSGKPTSRHGSFRPSGVGCPEVCLENSGRMMTALFQAARCRQKSASPVRTSKSYVPYILSRQKHRKDSRSLITSTKRSRTEETSSTRNFSSPSGWPIIVR